MLQNVEVKDLKGTSSYMLCKMMPYMKGCALWPINMDTKHIADIRI